MARQNELELTISVLTNKLATSKEQAMAAKKEQAKASITLDEAQKKKAELEVIQKKIDDLKHFLGNKKISSPKKDTKAEKAQLLVAQTERIKGMIFKA